MSKEREKEMEEVSPKDIYHPKWNYMWKAAEGNAEIIDLAKIYGWDKDKILEHASDDALTKFRDAIGLDMGILPEEGPLACIVMLSLATISINVDSSEKLMFEMAAIGVTPLLMALSKPARDRIISDVKSIWGFQISLGYLN